MAERAWSGSLTEAAICSIELGAPSPLQAFCGNGGVTAGTGTAVASLGFVPRYYLHVCNGSGFSEDEMGQEFPSEDAARQAAIDGLRDLMAAELRQGDLNLGSFVEIEDASHELVLTVSFEEAVRVRREHGPARINEAD